MPKPFTTGMVFGVYDRVGVAQGYVLQKAAELCETVVVAVSSDKEVEALFKKPSTVPLKERVKIVGDFCGQEGIAARVINEPDLMPDEVMVKCPVDAYVLSVQQYEHFGAHTIETIRKHKLEGKIILV